ncbi:hypothetical protein [Mesobacillus foraminis]|uniref:hypothetical protein n=1 Tax=Mesobacillus foraminis TaxID=279826 RepID=UPI0013CE6385|nr:hypothetical protein [Mesobacillus foraminis]
MTSNIVSYAKKPPENQVVIPYFFLLHSPLVNYLKKFINSKIELVIGERTIPYRKTARGSFMVNFAPRYVPMIVPEAIFKNSASPKLKKAKGCE